MKIPHFIFKLWRSYVDWDFDRRFSVDTSGTLRPSDTPEGTNPYAGTPQYRFRSMLSNLAFEPSETTFVDFGCGKGRVLLMACQLGFKHVIGIELSRELSDIARMNVESFTKARIPQCEIRVLCEDALDFCIPQGKSLLYFYNPFPENSMRRILENVQRALNENFRKITIVYYNPRCGELFDAAEFLTPMKKGRQYSIYGTIRPELINPIVYVRPT